MKKREKENGWHESNYVQRFVERSEEAIVSMCCLGRTDLMMTDHILFLFIRKRSFFVIILVAERNTKHETSQNTKRQQRGGKKGRIKKGRIRRQEELFLLQQQVLEKVIDCEFCLRSTHCLYFLIAPISFFSAPCWYAAGPRSYFDWNSNIHSLSEFCRPGTERFFFPLHH
jgi:hypothetical protein